MHCGMAYESVHSLARGHVIRVCIERPACLGMVDHFHVMFTIFTCAFC